MSKDLVYRLRKRAEIRRQIPGRKSVENGEPDRIADILEEAADRIEKLENVSMAAINLGRALVMGHPEDIKAATKTLSETIE